MLIAAAAAPAAEVGTTLTVVGGQLSATPVPHQVALANWKPYRGTWRRSVVRIPVVVSDLRGTGAGWSLALRGVVVTNGGRPLRSARAAVMRVLVRCAGTCTRPRHTITGPTALSASASSRALVANAGSGMGRMRVLVEVAVAVPASRRGAMRLLPRVTRVTGP